MQNSKIEWTHHTFNPWWGCVTVSAGCEHCYAETFSKRTGHNIWGPAKTTTRRTFGEKHWREPLKWNQSAKAAGQRHRVFCASMADVFEDHPQVTEERRRLLHLIVDTPSMTHGQNREARVRYESVILFELERRPCVSDVAALEALWPVMPALEGEDLFAERYGAPSGLQ